MIACAAIMQTCLNWVEAIFSIGQNAILYLSFTIILPRCRGIKSLLLISNWCCVRVRIFSIQLSDDKYLITPAVRDEQHNK